MPLHAGIDQYRVRSAIQTFNTLNLLGVLSDTAIAAANTVEGVRTAIANGINNHTIHLEHVTLARTGSEAVTEMFNYGLLTDAGIVGLTTYAGFKALLTGSNPPDDDDSRVADGSWTYSGNAPSSTIING